MNAMTNAVTVSATFCTIVDMRSAIAPLTNVVSVAKHDVKSPLLFSVESNQPISLRKIAAIHASHEIKV